LYITLVDFELDSNFCKIALFASRNPFNLRWKTDKENFSSEMSQCSNSSN